MNAPDSDKQLAFLRARRAARVMAMRYLYQLDMDGRRDLNESELVRFWKQAAEMGEELGLNGAGDFDVAQAHAQALITKCLEDLDSLDTRITLASRNWTMERMSAVDRNLLRIAACEMRHFTANVPPLAAVDEAIELAKEYGDRHSARFVNGVLDALLRDVENGSRA